ncbi:MAG: tetratricopeptide repeat protein [Verrucomicrobiia bacterium]
MPVFSAETSPSTNAASRVRDDRSAALTLALQAVQQLQTQQRATLQAVEEARQQSEAAAQRYGQRVESLRHLLFALCAVVAVAMSGVVYYVSTLLSKLHDRGQLPQAFKCPLPAAAREPYTTLHVANLLARGQALLEQRHPVDALACFEQAIAIDGHATNAFIKKGAALERLGRLEEALASYESALALDDSHADAYIGKGNVLNRLERYQEALACFEQAAHNQHYLHTVPQPMSASL